MANTFKFSLPVTEVEPRVFSTRKRDDIKSRISDNYGAVFKTWNLTVGHYLMLDHNGPRQVFIKDSGVGLFVEFADMQFIPGWLSEKTGLPAGAWKGGKNEVLQEA